MTWPSGLGQVRTTGAGSRTYVGMQEEEMEDRKKETLERK